MAFEKIGQSLEHSFRRGPIRSAVLALQVEKEARKNLPEWAEMISFSAKGGSPPEAGAPREQASGRREGRLLLGTPSPAHAQELYLKSFQLRQKINEGLGGEVVKEVKLKIKV